MFQFFSIIDGPHPEQEKIYAGKKEYKRDHNDDESRVTFTT